MDGDVEEVHSDESIDADDGWSAVGFPDDFQCGGDHGDVVPRENEPNLSDLFGPHDTPDLFEDLPAGHSVPDTDGMAEAGFVQASSDLFVHGHAWNSEIAFSSTQHRSVDSHLLLPWETGVMAEIFGDLEVGARLPENIGLAELALPATHEETAPASAVSTELESYGDACYIHAVQNLKDLEYFESKSQQLDLACALWLEVLSQDWTASGVGTKCALALQQDASGASAVETLKACFGVKSPSTILKRVASFKKFFSWLANHSSNPCSTSALNLHESDVWDYFNWLREKRQQAGQGFTVCSSFLEAVRFAKFVVELHCADSILHSARLLGFASLEKKLKGPTRQAPSLELEHLKRLHEILSSESNLTDRLGAGCFLVCVYARARWSDVRFVSHVEVDKKRNGSFTLFTMEHKTSSVGMRREQYLPLVIPWDGVVREDWLSQFLQVYEECGLDINKSPLGPLLPAPKAGGGFCARPLTTSEASAWLKKLLQGTKNAAELRSHSLKATLLTWCAMAGFEKELRAVLGHHCSAVSGSEVVYSRHLQVRALRKLAMLLNRVRLGLDIEDDMMKNYGISSTPPPMTPGVGPRTPAGVCKPAAVLPERRVSGHDGQQEEAPSAIGALNNALDEMQNVEDLQQVKNEEFDSSSMEQHASSLTLFGTEVTANGLVEISSSSGSSSDGSSSSTSSTEEVVLPPSKVVSFFEEVPANQDYHRHLKSGIVHSTARDGEVTKCKIKLSDRYRMLDRVFHVKYPKCIRCFPQNHNRLRSVSELTKAFDDIAKRRRS